MVSFTQGGFGSSIDTNEITNGAVTLAKLDTTGSINQVLLAQGAGNAPIWGSAGAMQLIQTQNPSSASNVTFSGLAGYQYYKLVFQCHSSGTQDQLQLRFNADSGNNYDFKQILSASVQAVSTSTLFPLCNVISSSSSGGEINVYASADTANNAHLMWGSILSEDDGANTISGRWRNASAVSSIVISIPNSKTITGTFSLYGIQG